MARGIYLALVFHVSIAPESPDFKSAGCKAVTLGQLEIFTFYKKKSVLAALGLIKQYILLGTFEIKCHKFK